MKNEQNRGQNNNQKQNGQNQNNNQQSNEKQSQNTNQRLAPASDGRGASLPAVLFFVRI